nr:MAG TPA: hypothetical protein [Caudoviricetes sp.]
MDRFKEQYSRIKNEYYPHLKSIMDRLKCNQHIFMVANDN